MDRAPEPEPCTRADAVVAWVREHEDEINAADRGCVEIHFKRAELSFNWQRYYDRKVKTA